MDRQDDINERAAREIWSNALQRSTKPFTWGLNYNRLKTIKEGTTFRVKNAWVQIQKKKENSFRLTIIFDSSKNRFVSEGLLLSDIVSAIDDALTHEQLFENSEYRRTEIISERVAV